ncbi:hypothetical protein [Paenibacillus sp. RC84]|uniref:hypothetical protein n=1 Tax=Paenibacillus sp. RC84 TaxID=3156252 RepID=UPI003512BC17
MKRVFLGGLLLVVLLALTGCAKERTIETPVTLEQVKEALAAEGIEMFEETDPHDWTLNGRKPVRYSVGRPTEKAVYKEFVSIYVYESGLERQKAMTEFNKLKQSLKGEEFLTPLPIEQQNVLLLYWAHLNGTSPDSPKAKLDEEIKRALQLILQSSFYFACPAGSSTKTVSASLASKQRLTVRTSALVR